MGRRHTLLVISKNSVMILKPCPGVPGLITHLTQGDMKGRKLEKRPGIFSNRPGFSLIFNTLPQASARRAGFPMVHEMNPGGRTTRVFKNAIMSRGANHNSERV
jgi:hypothetical protein